jgi:PAS domain S-box-containing protein
MMVRSRRPLDLEHTLEHINVPSAVVDRHGRITWHNRAARRWFGDVRGRPLAELVVPEHRERVQRQLQRKLEGGAGVTDYEVEVTTRDGRRHRVEISSVAIEGGDAAHAIFGVAVPGPPVPAGPVSPLSPRQTQVLRLLAEGASTREIAEMLNVSTETVRNHVRHILRALGAHSRLEAVALAYQQELLP